MIKVKKDRVITLEVTKEELDTIACALSSYIDNEKQTDDICILLKEVSEILEQQ